MIGLPLTALLIVLDIAVPRPVTVMTLHRAYRTNDAFADE